MNDNFSSKLRDARKEKCLTQEQTAEIFNVSHRWVQYLESGKRTPGAELAKEICIFFDISL